MLQKRVSISLFALLLCHTLASAIVGIAGWWRAENDLSERLSVYRSVDSIVEFQVPLSNRADSTLLTRTTEDGFSYRGRYYTVVSLDVKGDTLQIKGIEARCHSMWQDDLLAFLDGHLTESSDTNRKSGQLLKLLLKEYSPGTPVSFCFSSCAWSQASRISDALFSFTTRSVFTPSPPPQQA